MNKIKKKRNHYVWRSYLRNWSVNDHIQTYFIKSKKLTSTNLMNVGVQKYFHRIKKFSKNEYEICKSLFKLLPITKSSSAMVLLELFSGINNPDMETIDKTKKKAYQEFIDLDEHNFLEEYFTIIENIGIPYLELIKAHNTGFLNELEKRGEFLYFIIVQYCRTKNRRDRVKESLLNLPINIDKSIDLDKICILFLLQIADQIATVIALDNNYKFFFLKNLSATTFITSDQPVVNIMDDPYAINEMPKELEIFYPLGPNKALVVKKSNEDSNVEIDIGETIVKYYNTKMVKHAKDQIYFDKVDHEIIRNLIRRGGI